MTYIYKLDNNSLIAIILFLQTDDIYEYSETCKMFYNITKYIQKLPYIPNYLKFNKTPCDYHYVQSINLIKWAKQHKNFNYTNTTANYASRRGNLDILKYLYFKKRTPCKVVLFYLCGQYWIRTNDLYNVNPPKADRCDALTPATGWSAYGGNCAKKWN